MVEMDSTPSIIPGAPKILKLDSYNSDFQKILPDFYQNIAKFSIILWENL